MPVCVDSYLLAHIEETLEAWKRKRLFTENFVILLGILDVSVYYLFQKKNPTKQKPPFFYGFNFYHTKRLRISKTFHSRNQHNLAPDCSYIRFYPDLIGPQLLMLLQRLYQHTSFGLRTDKNYLLTDDLKISWCQRRSGPTNSSV